MTPLTIGLTREPARLETTLRLLVAGYNREAYDLPDQLIGSIRSAAALTAAATRAGAAHARLDGQERGAIGATARHAAILAARSGQVPDDPSAPVREAEARMARLALEAAFLGLAASEATESLSGDLGELCDEVGEALSDALSETLEAAEPLAEQVRGLNLANASALIRTSEAQRRALAALEPLSARHDAIRSAAVALQAYVPAWTGIRDFTGPGSGIDTPRPGGSFVDKERPYRFNPPPGSHPIARLVDAALAVAEPA